ncbi:MAG: O-antigen ligase family protein [Terriglobia bacterium]|jgi:hypothetical protein
MAAASSFAALLAIAWGVARSPYLALAMGAGVSVVVLAWAYPARLERLALVSVGLLLVGYCFLGKGLAYLPAPPIFVSEIVLALGVAAVVLSGAVGMALRLPLSWLIIAFAVDGALRTIPYLSVYGVDALRDAVIWGYGAYAIIVCALVLRLGCLSRVVRAYGRLVPWLLVGLPVIFVFQNLGQSILPKVLGLVRQVTIPYLKPVDVAVHLAGAAVFLILGLNRREKRLRGFSAGPKEWFLWLAWLVGILVAASINRGGFVAVIAALAVTFLVRPFGRWGKPLVLGVALVGALVVANLKFDVGARRSVSLSQLTSNLTSVFRFTGEPSLDGTRAWRLRWWSVIINYTVQGRYFWNGKGYGVNLADDDGFTLSADHALRSPHNSHMTVLARAGVPGLFLWLLLQAGFAFSMLRAYFRARGLGQEHWAHINLWILSYWTAFMVAAGFDVYLEGPQAGIWFWCLIGFGMATLQAQKRQIRLGTSPGDPRANGETA